jgi:glycosyltransferase involved in cell wall biosynthesis
MLGKAANRIRTVVSDALLAMRARTVARPLRRAEPRPGAARACYLSRHFPGPPAGPGQLAMGGEVKMAGLATAFPHSFPACDLLYVVSSVGLPGRQAVVDRARSRGIPVVLNQNGVYYPASGGPRWQTLNRPLAALRRAADFIVYQTEFCKLACDTFLGPLTTPSTVACNAIDTTVYTPAEVPPSLEHPIIVALWGAGGRNRRTTVTVESFLALRRRMPTAKLVFPGYHAASAQHRETRRMMDDLVRAAGQPLDCVEYLPRYTGGEAPGIFRRGHVLLHTQPNDNCPHLVVEAMACGVPIVHQDNGGTPQMVTPLAGVAVPSATSWDKLDYPAPEAFADGLEKVLRDWPAYHRHARARAIEFMSLDAFLREHRRVFEIVCPHLKGSSS